MARRRIFRFWLAASPWLLAIPRCARRPTSWAIRGRIQPGLLVILARWNHLPASRRPVRLLGNEASWRRLTRQSLQAAASPTLDPLDVPRNLNSIVNANSVTLDWDPPSVAPDGYLILRRSQGDADYDEIGIVFEVEVDDPTIYTDDRLDRAGTYEYAVMAIFLDGDGHPMTSDPVIVTVREEDLASPTPTADRHANGDRDANRD